MYTYTTSILVLMSVVGYTKAAVAIYPAREKPAEFADQEGCYLDQLQKVIPYGDYYPKNSCSKYTCYRSNEIHFVTRCGLQVKDPKSPCELISNESQYYPECCPVIKCPKYISGLVIVENLTFSGPDKEESTDVPLLKYLSTNKYFNEETTERASEETTVVPIVDHQTTSKTEVPGTSDAPTQYRIINDETVNELLIAQASINTK